MPNQLTGDHSMSSVNHPATTAASYAAVGLGNAVSWAVSVDFGLIASGLTMIIPVIAGGIALIIKRVNRQLAESSVERMLMEADARRKIEAQDKDSLASQIEALRKENRLLMIRLGEKVEQNTGAIDRIVSPDTGTSDMEALKD